MNEVTLNETLVLDTLRQVMDPELGCSIVDLGLVYDIGIEGRRVDVKMTLTTPGCPMQRNIAHGVRLALLQLDAVQEVEVEMVWDPPWTPSMMTEEGRRLTGIQAD